MKEEFLKTQIATIEDHLIRTIILKNSPFSKALIHMLAEWENYLIIAKNILNNLLSAQTKFSQIKYLFKLDEFSKNLPI